MALCGRICDSDSVLSVTESVWLCGLGYETVTVCCQ
jgi:hypothetical protein